MADSRGSPHVVRLQKALFNRGIPAELDRVIEGYHLGLAITAADESTKINVEVCEYKQGHDVVRLQRQWQLRDDNIRRLGWRVDRVPAWRAYLEPDRVADEIAALVHG